MKQERKDQKSDFLILTQSSFLYSQHVTSYHSTLTLKDLIPHAQMVPGNSCSSSLFSKHLIIQFYKNLKYVYFLETLYYKHDVLLLVKPRFRKLPHAFVNKTLLKHSHTHLSMYCLWLLFSCDGSAEKQQHKLYCLQSLKHL